MALVQADSDQTRGPAWEVEHAMNDGDLVLVVAIAIFAGWTLGAALEHAEMEKAARSENYDAQHGAVMAFAALLMFAGLLVGSHLTWR